MKTITITNAFSYENKGDAGILLGTINAIKLFSHSNKYLINHYDNLKAISDSDLVIICGGVFLGGKKIDSIIHVFQMIMNTR